MQLNTRQNNVKQNGNIGIESEFSIAVNPKMFKVLSDTMYQNKIGSMIRELSCNAGDAHIQAGTPTLPFLIHLPNAIEPWFSVRDTGLGLSDADVRVLYTTYGESTKDQSNDVTGAFGLGSKTPFAYTDQFTIVSIYDGMKRTYVAMMNDIGLPVLNMKDERATKEHAGLEVTVAVNSNDFETFRTEVVTQLMFFPIKPKLINNLTEIEFTDLYTDAIKFRNDDLVMYSCSHTDPIKNIWVVQGGVGYPLALNRLDGIDDNTSQFAKAIERENGFLTFNIGDISVTANREGISYEPETIKKIIKKISDLSTTICEDAITEIKAAKYSWDRAKIYNDQISVIQKAIVVSLGNTFETLFKGTHKTRSSHSLAINVDRITALDLRLVKMEKHTFHRRDYTQGWRLDRKVITADNENHYGSNSLIPYEDTVILIRDTNKQPVKRLKKYGEENNFPTIIVIEPEMGGLVDATVNQIANLLGISPKKIGMLSDLPMPPTVAGQPTGKRAKGYIYGSIANLTISTSSSRDWIPSYDDIDDMDETIYIEMHNHTIKYSEAIDRVLALAKDGNIDTPIMAVNGQTYKRVVDGKIGVDNMITPEQALLPIQDSIDAVVEDYKRFIRMGSFIGKVKGGSIWRIMEKADTKSPTTSAIFAKIATLDAKVKVMETKLNGLQSVMAKVTNTNDERVKGCAAGEKLEKKLMKQYPMLQYIGYYTDDDEIADASNYIKMIDGA